MPETIKQLILGKLEKWGYVTDRIEIKEEPPPGMKREERKIWFHVRTTHLGFMRDLGFWRMDLNKFVVQDVFVENELLTLDAFEKKIRYFSEQERLFRQENIAVLARQLLDMESQLIHDPMQLLSPENYLKSTIIAISEALLGKKVIPIERDAVKEAVSMYKRMVEEANQGALNCDELLYDLAHYAATAKDHDKIDSSDYKEALDFLRGILQVLFNQYDKKIRLINIDDLKANIIVQYLAEWDPFARLPRNLKTPHNLFQLLLSATRAYYVIKSIAGYEDQKVVDIFEIAGG
jgi:tetratricopeptide (TPR) repeat protein